MVDTLLKRLEKVDGGVDSVEVASSIGVDHQLVVGAVKSLQSLGDVSFDPPESHRKSQSVTVNMRQHGLNWVKEVDGVGELTCVSPAVQVISADLRSSKLWELTEEGTEIAEQGSHEARVFSSIPLEGLPQAELMVSSWTDTAYTPAPAGLKMQGTNEKYKPRG